MPITAKLPPLFTRLLPYVALTNEFEDMPAAYVPMARLVMSALIAKAQELMKGKPHDAQCEAFVDHLVEAFTAMKTKISKEASEASRVVLAKVAAKCFKVADDTDRAGQATRETAKDFRKAVVMFEILLSGPIADQDQAAEWDEKKKYAKLKCTSIEKAISQGVKPVAGNPDHDMTPENVERQLCEAQEWLAQNASASAEEKEEYEARQRVLLKYRQLVAAAPAPGPPSGPPPSSYPVVPNQSESFPVQPPPYAVQPPPYAPPPARPLVAKAPLQDSPLQFARQTVSALQFSDFPEALRNIQAALRMINGHEPVIRIPESHHPAAGKIFDAEDTARHAVSALKFDDVPAAVRCLEDTLKHLTVASQ